MKQKKVRTATWIGCCIAGLCLCLAIGAAVYFLTAGNRENGVLTWSKHFQAADYFTYNTEVESSSKSISCLAAENIPYATQRYFSDDRDQMVADGIIPEMSDYPLYTCTASYNDDGSIYSVQFYWAQRGDGYSDLTITAGYQEVDAFQDCIVAMDEDDNVITPPVTVTERDGIQIVAEGFETGEKTLTFQNDTGWYQISGSWNDSYESVVALLDWVWEHPVDFTRFDQSLGVEYTYAGLEEYPDAFADCMPDFAALGYVLAQESLQLRDGVPYRFEGYYLPNGGDENQAPIHWCVESDPDYYDRQDALGDSTQLTEAILTDAIAQESSISFWLNGCLITIYGNADDVLQVLCSTLDIPAD